MKIKTIQCKSVLTKSSLPEADYCINPYVGCLHRCIYCYARFMKRFTGHTESWGNFLDIKINAPAVLRKELNRKPRRGTVLLGSVTDAYQPVEKRYQLSRAILEVLLEYDFPVSILTKSELVVRDIDLVQKFSKCEVGLTITMLDGKVSKDFEPCSSSPQQKIDALSILHSNGIVTYVFIGPILPGFTDIEAIFQTLQGKVDFVMAESLNMKCGNREQIEALLARKQSDQLSLYQEGFSRSYWEDIRKQLEKLSTAYKIPLKGFYQHQP